MLSSREIIAHLQKDGWTLAGVSGDHYQFHHPVKKGRVTVPHPKKDLKIKTIKSIEKQSGLKLI